MNKGTLFVVTGPSGAGKGTVLGKVFQQVDHLHFSISATTRAPREGEVDGVNYHFMTKENFLSLVEQGRFLEYAQYVGNYYGTPMAPVEEKLEQGIDVLLEIEVQGALKVMEKCPDAVSVFIAPPSLEELGNRLRGRGTETEDSIQRRLATAKSELELVRKYQHLIVNFDGRAEDAAKAVADIAATGESDSSVVIKDKEVFIENFLK